MGGYGRQHLVSQVIIRRFSISGQVVRYEFGSGRPQRRKPTTCMYSQQFISAAPRAAEKLWQTVEAKLPAALEAVEAGTIMKNPLHVSTVKECIALHLARSKAMQWTRGEAVERAANQLKAELLTSQKPWLIQTFVRRHGFFPAGSQGLELAADEFIREARPKVDTPASFWSSVQGYFNQFRTFLAPLELEISVPEPGAGEFLLGDAPALTLRIGSEMGGPRGGVPLDQANTVIMPLGPTHMASLGREAARHRLNARQVELTNRVQVLNAFSEVCWRPGSGLEDFLRKARI